MTTEERFWAKVDKSGECWLWTAAPDPDGYGRFKIDGRKDRAHRVSYALHFGGVPEGKCVCHDCPGGDNRLCVNPAHLFLGTRLDNNLDMTAKGRVRHGEPHPCATLTEDLVRYIRARYAKGGISQRRLARELKVGHKAVEMVLSGRTWKHVH